MTKTTHTDGPVFSLALQEGEDTPYRFILLRQHDDLVGGNLQLVAPVIDLMDEPDDVSTSNSMSGDNIYFIRYLAEKGNTISARDNSAKIQMVHILLDQAFIINDDTLSKLTDHVEEVGRLRFNETTRFRGALNQLFQAKTEGSRRYAEFLSIAERDLNLTFRRNTLWNNPYKHMRLPTTIRANELTSAEEFRQRVQNLLDKKRQLDPDFSLGESINTVLEFENPHITVPLDRQNDSRTPSDPLNISMEEALESGLFENKDGEVTDFEAFFSDPISDMAPRTLAQAYDLATYNSAAFAGMYQYVGPTISRRLADKVVQVADTLQPHQSPTPISEHILEPA